MFENGGFYLILVENEEGNFAVSMCENDSFVPPEYLLEYSFAI